MARLDREPAPEETDVARDDRCDTHVPTTRVNTLRSQMEEDAPNEDEQDDGFAERLVTLV